MTLIEFFEKDSIENICSSLTHPAERVILLGNKLKFMNRCADQYRTVLETRGINTEFICKTINRNNMESIISSLSEIVEEYVDCVFDLTGGDDLFLVAAGIVFERYKERNIQMHRFNIQNNTIIDADLDGKTILAGEAPKLTVEENVRIYGGDIIYDEYRNNTTYNWDMSDDFKADINAMWSICCQDPRLWNKQMRVFEKAEYITGNEESLTVDVSVSFLKDMMERDSVEYVCVKWILDSLYRSGILTSYAVNEDRFSVTYKNLQVKYCLTLAGQILEMKVYLAALESKDKDGSHTYNDVVNGVFIDWDGEIHLNQEMFDTENEIDVVMMRGMVPVFISCKNGYIDREELYKLNVVANRFGGKYAKKVLFATSLDDSDYSQFLRQRAKDMGIKVIEGQNSDNGYKTLVELNDGEWNKIMRGLWMN